jgi:hypothetical protein
MVACMAPVFKDAGALRAALLLRARSGAAPGSHESGSARSAQRHSALLVAGSGSNQPPEMLGFTAIGSPVRPR